jgi:hypothetical protein
MFLTIKPAWIDKILKKKKLLINLDFGLWTLDFLNLVNWLDLEFNTLYLTSSLRFVRIS